MQIQVTDVVSTGARTKVSLTVDGVQPLIVNFWPGVLDSNLYVSRASARHPAIDFFELSDAQRNQIDAAARAAL